MFIVKTADLKEQAHKFPIRKAYQNGILTAEGHSIPLKDIPHTRITIPKHILDTHPISPHDSPKDKGTKAEKIVRDVLTSHNIPTRTANHKEQLQGIDLIITKDPPITIQVKCDLKITKLHTLYAQTKERNL